MTEHTDYGLSDDVLNRAAEHVFEVAVRDNWPDPRDEDPGEMIQRIVATALPVLIPAVHDDATRRIKAWICQRAVTSPSDAYNEGYQDALADLWEYLSATEEAPDAK